jgi:hypothetical protein
VRFDLSMVRQSMIRWTCFPTTAKGIASMLATALFAAQSSLLTGGRPSLLYYRRLALRIVGVFTFGGS